MKNYVLVRPWRIVPIKDVLLFLEILQQIPPVPGEEKQDPKDNAAVH